MSAVANRYAKALVDVCLKQKVQDHVAADLQAFEELLNAHAELRAMYLNPAIPVPKKKAITTQVLQHFSFAQATSNFIQIMVDHHRIGYMAAIRRAFHQLLNEQLGVVQAEVTTATDLDAATQERLLTKLKALTGKNVVLKFTKDPGIIGGLVTRIGDTIYDGSIRQRLNTLKAQLSSD
ncbi:MAG: ATP synthase F1 subunit delta [Terriglobia bacterium]